MIMPAAGARPKATKKYFVCIYLKITEVILERFT